MNNRMSDHNLGVVISFLFAEFTKAAGRGVYLFFPPEKIEIISDNKVRFEAKEKSQTLRDGLREFGVTLYHLYSGKSELNCESYQLDGYPAIDSEYWLAIDFMLSGKAYSLPEVRKSLGVLGPLERCSHILRSGADFILKFISVLTAKIMAKFKALALLIIRHLCQLAISGWRGIKSKAGRVRPSAVFKTMLILLLFSMAVFVGYNFYRGLGEVLIGIAIVVVILVIRFIILVNSNISDDQAYSVFSKYFTALMALLVFLTFTAPVIGVRNNYILAERGTGKFVARLPLDLNDTDKVWPSRFINLFRYKPTIGIPISGNVSRSLYKQMEFFVAYRIKPDKYEAVWKKWGDRQELEAAIHQQMDDLNGSFAERLAFLKLPESKDYPATIDIKGDIDPHLVDSIKSKAQAVISGEIENAVAAARFGRLKSAMPQVLGAVDDLLSSCPLTEFLDFDSYTIIDNQVVNPEKPGTNDKAKDEFDD